jgi:hypothetical protein
MCVPEQKQLTPELAGIVPTLLPALAKEFTV